MEDRTIALPRRRGPRVREAVARLPDEPEEPEPPDEVDAMIDAEEEPGDDLDSIPEEADA